MYEPSTIWMPQRLTQHLTGYLKSVTGTAIFQADVFGARRLPSTSSSASTPTATPAPISCPASNDTIFTANSYARFEIGCDYETAGGDIGRAFVFSFEECVQTCDSTEGCVAASLSGYKSYLVQCLSQPMLTRTTSLLPQERAGIQE